MGSCARLAPGLQPDAGSGGSPFYRQDVSLQCAGPKREDGSRLVLEKKSLVWAVNNDDQRSKQGLCFAVDRDDGKESLCRWLLYCFHLSAAVAAKVYTEICGSAHAHDAGPIALVRSRTALQKY
jgi:hypothetical protein